MTFVLICLFAILGTLCTSHVLKEISHSGEHKKALAQIFRVKEKYCFNQEECSPMPGVQSNL